jgi:hypothetical protein
MIAAMRVNHPKNLTFILEASQLPTYVLEAGMNTIARGGNFLPIIYQVSILLPAEMITTKLLKLSRQGIHSPMVEKKGGQSLLGLERMRTHRGKAVWRCRRMRDPLDGPVGRCWDQDLILIAQKNVVDRDCMNSGHVDETVQAVCHCIWLSSILQFQERSARVNRRGHTCS